jgi:hypothetical protein
VAIQLPANGYLDREGNDWKCERGFSQQRLNCVALIVPTHGYLDYSGNEWSCTDGFRKQADACVPDR